MDEYRHFSHPHDLRLYQIQQGDQISNQNLFQCSACESLCHGAVYGCWSCKFFLHKACAAAPRCLRHPSHPSHHLTLLPSPTYPDASFLCNACGATGAAFCFSCAACDVDLHLNCALFPQQLHLNSHRHTLSLLFSSPSDLCNLCRRPLDSRYWAYGCSTCNFHVHTYCAMPPPELPGPAGTPVETDYGGVSQGGLYGSAECSDMGASPAVVVVEDPILKAQAELHELQMQMQIVNEMAKMMASVNLSSLV